MPQVEKAVTFTDKEIRDLIQTKAFALVQGEKGVSSGSVTFECERKESAQEGETGWQVGAVVHFKGKV